MKKKKKKRKKKKKTRKVEGEDNSACPVQTLGSMCNIWTVWAMFGQSSHRPTFCYTAQCKSGARLDGRLQGGFLLPCTPLCHPNPPLTRAVWNTEGWCEPCPIFAHTAKKLHSPTNV